MCPTKSRIMKRGLFFHSNILIFLYGFMLFGTSCVDTKQVTYFNNIPDAALPAQTINLEPVIQRGDLLSISVSSVNTESTATFNASNVPANGSQFSSNMLAQPVGYLVSQKGTIDFPMLGSMEVAGMTKEALKNSIAKTLEDKKLLFNPIVTVRYLNFHVTVLGEVGRPGEVTIPNEQVTILEALGLAGDMTIYGRRENVLLIRHENGQKIVRRLNLNSEKVLTSPYYYLKSNDVVYVEPNWNKVASVSQSRQWAPVIISTLSFLIIVLDRVVRF
jgi:polysaccharide export outer membrane protein